MLEPQRSSTRSPVRTGAVWLNALWLLLSMGCLPQDDLESYSRAWQSRPLPASADAGDPSDGSPPDAGVGSAGAPGTGGESAAVGGSGGALVDGGDAGLLAADAGVEPSESDASTGTDLDAGGAELADASAP